MNALAAFAGGRRMICERSGGLGNPRLITFPAKATRRIINSNLKDAARAGAWAEWSRWRTSPNSPVKRRKRDSTGWKNNTRFSDVIKMQILFSLRKTGRCWRRKFIIISRKPNDKEKVYYGRRGTECTEVNDRMDSAVSFYFIGNVWSKSTPLSQMVHYIQISE